MNVNKEPGTDAPQSVHVDVTFLGVGGASQSGLGHASAVVSFLGKNLLIDCGPGTTRAFIDRFQCLPDGVFITHGHLDHIGDFENLFIKAWFHQPEKLQPKVFVSAGLVPFIHERLGTYPSALAEGGINFWDAFQMIPVSREFMFHGLVFNALQVRHHRPGSAFGLRLPGAFFYSGDTRPIGELLEHDLDASETIFHDCGVVGNPSHTGIEDILKYPSAILERIHCYHYYTPDEVHVFQKAGLSVIKQGDVFSFQIP